MTRKYTRQLYSLIEQGLVDKDAVIDMCLSYMSESDVEDMMNANDLIEDEEEEL